MNEGEKEGKIERKKGEGRKQMSAQKPNMPGNV